MTKTNSPLTRFVMLPIERDPVPCDIKDCSNVTATVYLADEDWDMLPDEPHDRIEMLIAERIGLMMCSTCTYRHEIGENPEKSRETACEMEIVSL